MLPDSLPLNTSGWAAGVAAELEATIAQEPVPARLSLEWLPVAHLRSGAVVAWRAQLCWAHPRLGRLTRTDCLDPARRAGALARLDTWALHEAIEHLARTSPVGAWAVPVEVPVAPETLVQPYLAERLRGRCQAAGVDPGLVRLVVEEDATVDGPREGSPTPDRLLDPLNGLAAAGLGLVLADAASSRLALGGLVGLPVAGLALPMAWVRETMRDAVGGQGRLGAFLRVARALGGEVEVTDVDDPQDLELLRQGRVQVAQGRAVQVSATPAAHILSI